MEGKELIEQFMGYWNTKSIISSLASFIWNLSESTGIPLGFAAPWVFGLMIGSMPKNVKNPAKTSIPNESPK